MEGMKVISVIADMIGYVQKSRVSAQVRQSHLAKAGKQCDVTEGVMKKAKEFEDWLNEQLAVQVKAHPAYLWFVKIKGIGNVNIGKIIAEIDIRKAKTISALWRFAGFAVGPDGHAERRKKGEKSHYNQTLKTMVWRACKSLIRVRGPYYDFYAAEKAKLRRRFEAEGKEIVPSSKLPKINGKRSENDQVVALGHIEMMAFRKMAKLFLAHLWLKWREAEGLPVSMPYSIGIQGHSDFIGPDEMIGEGKSPKKAVLEEIGDFEREIEEALATEMFLKKDED